MKTAFDQYIEWLNTDPRRNNHHIMMAKKAKEYEVELLAQAFELGRQSAIEKTKEELEQYIKENESKQSD